MIFSYINSRVHNEEFFYDTLCMVLVFLEISQLSKILVGLRQWGLQQSTFCVYEWLINSIISTACTPHIRYINNIATFIQEALYNHRRKTSHVQNLNYPIRFLKPPFRYLSIIIFLLFLIFFIASLFLLLFLFFLILIFFSRSACFSSPFWILASLSWIREFIGDIG